MPASHCMPPPPCSASGCASRGRMAATSVSSLLGLVPSELEIGRAICALLDPYQNAPPSSGLEMSLSGSWGPGILISSGWRKVRQALQLPAIKRLVISIALDKALGSAIMNNPSVQELFLSDKATSPQIREEGIAWGTNKTSSLLNISKDKILDLVQKFELLLNEKFQPPQPAKPEAMADLDAKVGRSLLLSALIILVIALA